MEPDDPSPAEGIGQHYSLLRIQIEAVLDPNLPLAA
jgi:hypothetical protein